MQCTHLQKMTILIFKQYPLQKFGHKCAVFINKQDITAPVATTEILLRCCDAHPNWTTTKALETFLIYVVSLYSSSRNGVITQKSEIAISFARGRHYDHGD